MMGFQQALIIGLLRKEFEKNSQCFFTIKEIHNNYLETYPNMKQLNYKTLATILNRLADQGKIDYKIENNRSRYRYLNIESQEITSLLKILVSAFGVPGLTHLIKKTDNSIDEDE